MRYSYSESAKQSPGNTYRQRDSRGFRDREEWTEVSGANPKLSANPREVRDERLLLKYGVLLFCF